MIVSVYRDIVCQSIAPVYHEYGPIELDVGFVLIHGVVLALALCSPRVVFGVALLVPLYGLGHFANAVDITRL